MDLDQFQGFGEPKAPRDPLPMCFEGKKSTETGPWLPSTDPGLPDGSEKPRQSSNSCKNQENRENQLPQGQFSIPARWIRADRWDNRNSPEASAHPGHRNPRSGETLDAAGVGKTPGPHSGVRTPGSLLKAGITAASIPHCHSPKDTNRI